MQRARKIVGNEAVGNDRVNGGRVIAGDAESRFERHQALRRIHGPAKAGRHVLTRPRQNDEAAAAHILLTNQVEASLRLVVGGHDHVLQQIAERRFDRALEFRIDVEVVGHRTLLAYMPVGLRENHARRLCVSGSSLLEIGQRREARRQSRQLALPRTEIVRFPLELDASARQLRLSRRLRVQRSLRRIFRPAQPVGGCSPIALEPLLLHPDLGLFHGELRELIGHALRGFLGVLNRMPQRRRDIQRRKDLGSRGLDVGFEPFDAAVLVAVLRLDALELESGPLLILLGRGRLLLPLGQQQPSGLTARLERRKLLANLFGASGERRDLLPVEFNLLLPPGDVELARVHRLARSGRRGFGLDERDSDTAEIRLCFGHRGRGRRLPFARVRQACPQGFDSLCSLLITAGEQQLLPVTQLVAQPLVPARFRGLSLERAELLFELEDDVFQAREVLRRGLELELGCAAPRLVLGDAGGFLYELAPVRRSRAEDHPDLALLDDGVGLGAQACVHQELVHVAQPADLAVDEIFALARSIQPPRHFDGARNRRRVVFQRVDRGDKRHRATGLCQKHVAQAQTHLGSTRGLSRIAAVEDHVFHPVAAKALGALFAQHPGDGVGDVALAAPVWPDDSGDAAIEREVRSIRERFEAGDFKLL